MKKLLVSLFALVAVVNVSKAQEVALKTNLAYWGISGANMAVEFSVAPKWTLGAEMTGFLWGYKKLDFNGWFASAEARFYLCEAFNGHHFGAYFTGGNLPYAYVDVKLLDWSTNKDIASKEARRDVIAWGLGISYGYYFKFNRGWGLDLYVGYGIQQVRRRMADGTNDWTSVFPMLNKVGVSLCYKF